MVKTNQRTKVALYNSFGICAQCGPEARVDGQRKPFWKDTQHILTDTRVPMVQLTSITRIQKQILKQVKRNLYTGGTLKNLLMRYISNTQKVNYLQVYNHVQKTQRLNLVLQIQIQKTTLTSTKKTTQILYNNTNYLYYQSNLKAVVYIYFYL